MEIPRGEYWYIFQGGPEAGYIFKSLDEIGVGEGFGGYRCPTTNVPGGYFFKGEISNGLRVVVWRKYDWELPADASVDHIEGEALEEHIRRLISEQDQGR